ncbi:MAG: 16S rRNA (guanine(966)-N(2))-methyltransferase RsmD [Candidatus Nanopelagicales bacterium]|nr:16S rRNA (guanine(966)-N(2))-methyltransferase RsmD [Candidatus Nanopelagicales bacterium]
MTRIIAGTAGGRRIVVPARGTRPTSDRVRESVFSSLGSEREWSGIRVLDLFAGSGALGLESLSRGAGTAVFVDSDSAAADICRRNVSALDFLASSAEVVRADVSAWLERGPGSRPPFDLVFADPPYAVDDNVVGAVLDALVDQMWLAEGARVIVERSAGGNHLKWPAGWQRIDERAFGGTVIYRAVWYGPSVT